MSTKRDEGMGEFRGSSLYGERAGEEGRDSCRVKDGRKADGWSVLGKQGLFGMEIVWVLPARSKD